jgi:hypothetical protein
MRISSPYLAGGIVPRFHTTVTVPPALLRYRDWRVAQAFDLAGITNAPPGF